ncbi:MAG: hypothetical protein SOZ40_05550 [Ezakiella sp.]|nr:hypothetical protein [Ezakiella sp.]
MDEAIKTKCFSLLKEAEELEKELENALDGADFDGVGEVAFKIKDKFGWIIEIIEKRRDVLGTINERFYR